FARGERVARLDQQIAGHGLPRLNAVIKCGHSRSRDAARREHRCGPRNSQQPRAGGATKMQIRDGFIGTVGNTPLIKLQRASAMTGCTILGKAEFLNRGGSVKDRPARHMILEAEKRGELRAGGLVVESTAGNTGIGLALVANARGYRTTIVIPETQSQEKKDTLPLCRAELI